jgi:prepilin-type N-terminal cleavage/methylation domain-containing protein
MRMQSRRIAPRHGFTLAELLITLSVILVIVALSVGAVLKFRDVGPFQATVASMNAIKTAVDTQWKAIADKAKNDPLPSSYPGNKADPATRENFVKDRLKQAFPMTFQEVFTGTPSIGTWSGYVNFLGTLGVTSGNVGTVTTPVQEQSAICLLMALTVGPSHTVVNADAYSSAAVQQFTVLSTRTNGFADAWGRALVFSREAKGASPNPMVPGILSYGKDGKPGVPFTWTPNPDNNDDISSLTQ